MGSAAAHLRRCHLVSPRLRLQWIGAAVVIAAFAVILLTSLNATRFGWYFDDIGLGVLAATASLCAWRRARRASAQERRSWLLLALACASWAAGEVWWCWLELGRGQDPFPSLADIGYLGFPVAAAAALLAYPVVASTRNRQRVVLDALLATSALALISWETVLDALLRQPHENNLAFAVSFVYPITDVMVVALVVITIANSRTDIVALSLTAAGCGALAVSDSLFGYLTAVNAYSGGAADLGYVVAFVLLALAALHRDEERFSAVPPGSGKRRRREAASALRPTPERASFWPYIPVIAGAATTLASAATGHPPTTSQLSLAAVVVGLVLVRQYLTMHSNNELAEALAAREAELFHQAFHDRLTGLPNRALFQDRLRHALELHRRDLRPVSVIFLDIDDFKLVNDTLGHAAGDELLRRVSERLTGGARVGDTVARLGGDEFAVLLEDGGDAVVVASRIADALRTPFVRDGQQHTVSASIGVCDLGAADVSPGAEVLLMKADTAMYAAKRAGKDRIALFHEGMSLTELADHQLATELAAAMATGDLALEYQPVVDLDTGRLVSLEALARWTRGGEPVSPALFIPLAERTGLIGELTAHVLRLACAQLTAWTAALQRRDPSSGPRDDLRVAVNVPPNELTRPQFVTMVRGLIDSHGLRPGQLELEITESGTFDDLEAARDVIGQLRRSGVTISLDDFGVGNSSFAQLLLVELDCVKIDKSFIETLESSPRQAQFLRALLRFSDEVGLRVIVEGIERPEQLQALCDIGSPLAQGFLFSRPLPPDDCLQLLVEGTATVNA